MDEQLRATQLLVGDLLRGEPIAATQDGYPHMGHYVQRIRAIDAEAAAALAAAEEAEAAKAMAQSLPEVPERTYDLVFGGKS